MTSDQVLVLTFVWLIALICMIGWNHGAHRKVSPRNSNGRMRKVLQREVVYRDDESRALYCPLDGWEPEIERARRLR
jgi:hypothetical protein